MQISPASPVGPLWLKNSKTSSGDSLTADCRLSDKLSFISASWTTNKHMMRLGVEGSWCFHVLIETGGKKTSFYLQKPTQLLSSYQVRVKADSHVDSVIMEEKPLLIYGLISHNKGFLLIHFLLNIVFLDKKKKKKNSEKGLEVHQIFRTHWEILALLSQALCPTHNCYRDR